MITVNKTCLHSVMNKLKALKVLFVSVIVVILVLILSCIHYNVHKSYIHETLSQGAISKKLMSGTVYLERIEHLNKMCTRFNKTSPSNISSLADNPDLLNHILVDSKHQLLYCFVPKVATTNWKRVFMIISGASNTTNVLSIPANLAHNKHVLLTLSNFSYHDVEYLLNTYTKFLFVRHPFERLLSAFRNKLERNYVRSKYFQTRVGRYIVKTFRLKPDNSSLQKGDDITFNEFTTYLSKSTSQSFNEHWRPIEKLCDPCRIGYDFIGKFETLISDSNFILQSAGISNIRFPHNIKAAITYKELKKYFSALPPSRIKDLYNIYERDFKLFSYNLQDLLGYEVG